MTMTAMDKYFEEKGFRVTRKYLPASKLYKFDISKNGCAKQYFWEYPNGGASSDDQVKAMNAMIEDFEKTFPTTNGYRVLSETIEYTYMSEARDKVAYDTYARPTIPEIKNVIFNKPATIVLWADGTKTVVKAQGKSRYDKEKGLAMCIAKKALGNKGNYYNTFAKWLND